MIRLTAQPGCATDHASVYVDGLLVGEARAGSRDSIRVAL
jgi:hypothetical protein